MIQANQQRQLSFTLQYQKLVYYETVMNSKETFFTPSKTKDNSFMSLGDEARQTGLFAPSKVSSDNQQIKGGQVDKVKMQRQGYCVSDLSKVQNIFEISSKTAKIQKEINQNYQETRFSNALKLLQILQKQGSMMDLNQGFKLYFLNPQNQLVSAYEIASSLIKVRDDLNVKSNAFKLGYSLIHQFKLTSSINPEELEMEIILKWRTSTMKCQINLTTGQSSYIPPCSHYMEILFDIIEYVAQKEGLSQKILGLDANNYHLLQLFSSNTVLKVIKQLNPTGQVQKYIKSITKILQLPMALKPVAYIPIQNDIIDVKIREKMEEWKKKIVEERKMLYKKSSEMMKLMRGDQD